MKNNEPKYEKVEKDERLAKIERLFQFRHEILIANHILLNVWVDMVNFYPEGHFENHAEIVDLIKEFSEKVDYFHYGAMIIEKDSEDSLDE